MNHMGGQAMETRGEMMRQLARLQDEIGHQDILTITGYMTDAELAVHVARYELRAALAEVR